MHMPWKAWAGLCEVEIEPEVRAWLASLSDRDFGRVDFLVGLLAEHAGDLGEPCTRHLGGKVRELRFHLLGEQIRVTYWLVPATAGDLIDGVPQDPQCRGRRSDQGKASAKICETSHGIAHQVFDREVT
jgi:hypothetical protein